MVGVPRSETERVHRAKEYLQSKRSCAFFGSEEESVNTCVFAGFLSDRVSRPPVPERLVHARYCQCFTPFCDTFHIRTWPRLLSGIRPLIKGWLKRACTAQVSSSRP